LTSRPQGLFPPRRTGYVAPAPSSWRENCAPDPMRWWSLVASGFPDPKSGIRETRQSVNTAQIIEFMRFVTRARLQSGLPMGEGNMVGFSPCTRHRPAIGNGTWRGWQGLKPLLSDAFVAARLKSCPCYKTDRGRKAPRAGGWALRYPTLAGRCGDCAARMGRRSTEGAGAFRPLNKAPKLLAFRPGPAAVPPWMRPENGYGAQPSRQ
jgi:hypothetical protein